ncbi:MAG: T9SS type A sorting domain-containing protein [Bacteroidales bacterium]|nr:T9SS type A sorting domain-containing protein [Bacteroidales bacterium]
MKKNDFFGIVAIICLLFANTLLRAQTVALEPADRAAGIGGTITNLAELRWVSENDVAWSEEWVLSADIDATETKDWNGGLGFSPIGNSTTPFSGIFDGNNHTIARLYVAAAIDEGGLFGNIRGISDTELAMIQNIGVEGANISIATNAGALAGKVENAQLTQCFAMNVEVTNSKDNTSASAGALLAYAKGTVVIQDCYATGLVGGRKAGGVIGTTATSSGIAPVLNNVYGACSVSGATVGPYLAEGGLIAHNLGSGGAGCFFDNSLTSAAIGVAQSGSFPTNAGMATADFANAANFTGWDFITTWEIKSLNDETRPYFTWHQQYTTAAVEPADRVEGSGGTITNIAELRWVSENDIAWSEQWFLNADIDAAETKDWNSGEGFSPIGNSTTPFTGVFDGDNHTITNLFLAASVNEGGLFGNIRGISDMEPAIIQNIGIVSAKISIATNAGALAGKVENAEISKCFALDAEVTNSIDNTSASAGALLAYAKGSVIIQDCYATGSVDGRKAGGVIGTTATSSGIAPVLNNVYGACTVSGATVGPYLAEGGLIAHNLGSGGTGCYFDNSLTSAAIGVAQSGSFPSNTGLATADFANNANFTGWDFITTWEVKTISSQTRPFFTWQDGNTPTSINDLNKEADTALIYPNPASDYFIINSAEERVSLQIYSLSGAKVFERTVITKSPVDVSGLVNGVYIIRVNNFTQKLIVK